MKYADMSGLTIKNGRLINERGNCTTGIQKAVDLKKSMYQQKKVNMITQGILNAKMIESITK